MAKLTMTTFVTLDGIMQAPGGPEEDRSGGFAHGGWLVPFFESELGQFMDDVFKKAGGFLLGRGTYQIFAAYWPRVTDPKDLVAERLNSLPKHVATRTLETLDWRGSSVLHDVLAEVPRLKEETRGELQVHGSAGLAQTLLASGLVDELNLVVAPVLLGAGKRLFGAGAVPTSFELAGGARSTPTGVILATYRRVGRPTYGTMGA